MGKIGAITVGLAFTALTSGLSGCEGKKAEFPQSEKLLTEFVQEPSENIASGWRSGSIGRADAQLSIDSAAYRTVFNSTNAVRDSKTVVEFNAIAGRNRIPDYITTEISASMHLSRKMRMIELPIEEMKPLNEYAAFISVQGDPKSVAKKQYIIDSIAYNRFFEKNNLRNDTVVKQIKNIARKIKP